MLIKFTLSTWLIDYIISNWTKILTGPAEVYQSNSFIAIVNSSRFLIYSERMDIIPAIESLGAKTDILTDIDVTLFTTIQPYI